jgi:hypothetical protein
VPFGRETAIDNFAGARNGIRKFSLVEDASQTSKQSCLIRFSYDLLSTATWFAFGKTRALSLVSGTTPVATFYDLPGIPTAIRAAW